MINAANSLPKLIAERSRGMTIQTRFMLYFSSVVITLMACVIVIVGERQSRSMLSQAQERGTAVANSIAATVTNSLMSYDLMGLQSAAQKAKDTTGVSYVIILNKEHHIAGFSDQPGLQLSSMDDPASAAVESATDLLVQRMSAREEFGIEGEHLDIAVPVFVGESKVRWGTIRVGLSLVPMQIELAKTRRLLMTLAAISVFIVLWAARYFTSKITHPLRGLAEATTAIASGDLDHAVDEDLVGELGELAHSFNKMTTDLKRSRDAIRYQNQHLENMVQERTSALREKARELERANAELMEVDRLKSDFLSNVSHELRTPLTSIRSFTEIMLDKTMELSDEERLEFLEIVSNQAHRLTRLISDLLDLSKIEAGEFHCYLETIAVDDFIEPCLETMRNIAYEKDVELRSAHEAELPQLVGDSDRLSQVLTNLVDNALKFTPAGGSIIVTARSSERRVPEEIESHFRGIVCDMPETGSYVIISVKDSGVGIGREDQQRIFDKFGQVGNVLTSKPQGTGLGLAISGNIMVQHGGAIWVESEVDEGSTFSFSVPVFAATEPMGSNDFESDEVVPVFGGEASFASMVQGGTEFLTALKSISDGRRILVVDDDPDVVLGLTELMEPEGFRVLGCHSGSQAVAKARDLRPDAIVVDALMPEINGFDVLRLLKGERGTTEIPVLILNDDEDDSRARALGAAASVRKPDLHGELFANTRLPS